MKKDSSWRRGTRRCQSWSSRRSQTYPSSVVQEGLVLSAALFLYPCSVASPAHTNIQKPNIRVLSMWLNGIESLLLTFPKEWLKRFPLAVLRSPRPQYTEIRNLYAVKRVKREERSELCFELVYQVELSWMMTKRRETAAEWSKGERHRRFPSEMMIASKMMRRWLAEELRLAATPSSVCVFEER